MILRAQFVAPASSFSAMYATIFEARGKLSVFGLSYC